MRIFWRKVHSFRWPYGYGSANCNGHYWPKMATYIATMDYYQRMRLYLGKR